MKKIATNTQDILNALKNLQNNERLAYLFEDNFTVVGSKNNYNLVEQELLDSNNVLLDAAVVSADEEFDFHNGKILLKNQIPNDMYICHHEHVDIDEKSSECIKCGELINWSEN